VAWQRSVVWDCISIHAGPLIVFVLIALEFELFPVRVEPDDEVVIKGRSLAKQDKFVF
jgi:hypothetical protein